MLKTTKNLIKFAVGFLIILSFVIALMPTNTAKAQSYTYGDTYSTVGGIYPATAKIRDNINTINISGGGFTQNSVARWNGATRNTTFIDSGHLLLHLNAGDLYGSSGRYVNVFTPEYGTYSNAIFFSINGYVPGNNYVAPLANSASNNNTNYSNNNGSGNTYSNNQNTQASNTNDTNNNYANTNTNQSNNNSENGTNDSVSSLAANAVFGSTFSSFAPSGLIQWILFAIIILILVIIVRKFFGGSDKYHSTPLKHS